MQHLPFNTKRLAVASLSFICLTLAYSCNNQDQKEKTTTDSVTIAPASTDTLVKGSTARKDTSHIDTTKGGQVPPTTQNPKPAN